MDGNEAILRALGRAGEKTVVVFGDFCLDKYLYSHPSRDQPSVETGLAAHWVHRKAVYAGAGGTIAANLAALGARVRCAGPVGRDGEGYELRAALSTLGADTTGLCETPGHCTPCYTKPMRKTPAGGYAEQNRLDFRSPHPLGRAEEEALCGALERALQGADAVVLADQFCEEALGALTPAVRGFACALARRHPETVFLADSRAFAPRYTGVMLKCNHHEFAAAAGLPAPEDEAALRQDGLAFARRLGRPLFVTQGERGIWVFENGEAGRVPAFPVAGEIDVCGAGDATNAALALGLCLGLSPGQAAKLACCVSSLTIQQIGKTGTASREEVAARLQAAQNPPQGTEKKGARA